MTVEGWIGVLGPDGHSLEATYMLTTEVDTAGCIYISNNERKGGFDLRVEEAWEELQGKNWGQITHAARRLRVPATKPAELVSEAGAGHSECISQRAGPRPLVSALVLASPLWLS